MIVETHNNFDDPHRIEATRVVVRDRFDQPLVIALEVGEGLYQIYQQTDPEFPRVMEALGLDGTIVVDKVDTKALQKLPGTIWTP